MTRILHPTGTRLAWATQAAILAITVLLVAGCGSAVDVGGQPGQLASNADIQLTSGTALSNGRSGDGGTPSAPEPGPTAPAQWVQLSSTQSPLGAIVTDVNGHTLYRFDEDRPRPPTTNCSGPCATTWPPVTVAPGGTVFLDGTDGQKIGSVKRPDGTTQVTVGGWPVYRYSGDQQAGDTNGQGVKGTWFAVSPTGTKASTTSRAPQSVATSDTGTGGEQDPGSTALTTTKASSGTVITDGSGRTVYVSNKDSRGSSRSHCTSPGNCNGFTPVKARRGGRVSISGVKDSDVGSIRSGDGTEQMTLNGQPLYTSGDDKKRGDVRGDGRNGSWFALGLDADR